MVSKLIYSIKRYGLINFFNRLIHKFNLNLKLLDPIQKKRLFLSKEIEKISKGTVLSGEYKGTKFINSSDYFLAKSSQLLGTYELEVQTELINIITKNNLRYFINLGAGEGFHSVGIMNKKKLEKCISFEMDLKNVKNIERNFILNKIQNFEIFSKADINFLDKIINYTDFNKSIFLFDIEGEEFKLLNENNLKILSKSFLIIEIHHFYFDAQELKKFILKLKEIFNIRYITTSDRNYSNINEISKFNDDEKWLMMSESRPETMKWIVCEPKF